MVERESSAVSVLIACLCIGAAALAIVVLSSDDGGTAIAATLTATGAVPFFGLTGAAGIALCRRHSALALLGALTMVLSVLGFVAVVAVVLDDDFFSGGDTWMPAVYLLIACLVAAHCSALLADTDEADAPGLQLARAGMTLSLFVVALLVIIEISQSGKDIGIQPMAAIAVLYLLSASIFGLLRLNGAESR